MFIFSVLLSVYKDETPFFLNEALYSLLKKQNILPNEIILVKDGQLTTELNNIISIWVDEFPQIVNIIPLEKNVGLGNALNEGLKHCTNNWVFRMDTDDCCMPHRFEKQIEYIKNNPEVVLVGSNTEEFDSSMENSLGYRKVPCTHNEIRTYIKRRNPFNHMTVAFRKDIIESVGGYKHHLYMEDYNLWIRIVAEGHQVGNIDDVLVNVRGGDSMVKRRKGITYIKSEFQLAKLKTDKKIDTPLNAYLNCTLRSIPRLLPTSILSKVYKKLRK